MKKIIAVAVILLLSAGFAFAKAYEVNRKAGEYTVDIKMDKNPPSVGINNMEIAVTDKGGKPVKDAKVLVEYGMHAMPGMPAMNYKADAKPDGLRAFSAPVAARITLRHRRMAHASEILSWIHREGLRWCEVPVTVTYSPYSLGKGQRASAAVDIVWDLVTGRMR